GPSRFRGTTWSITYAGMDRTTAVAEQAYGAVAAICAWPSWAQPIQDPDERLTRAGSTPSRLRTFATGGGTVDNVVGNGVYLLTYRSPKGLTDKIQTRN